MSRKGLLIGFWIVTALFCLQMTFTAYAELRLPQVAAAFTHLGFPAYFRVELSWAKLLGVVLLLAPGALTLGASGAVFGLFGATAVFMRRMRYDMRPILILLALNIFFSFTWSNVSWQGHLGGLAAGTLIAIGMAYAPRERRDLVQWGTCAAVLVLSVAVSAIAVAQVTS